MVKFPEAEKRLIRGVFVCKRCKTKQRTSAQKVVQKLVKCRKCNSRSLRPLRKIKVAAAGK